MQVIHSKQLNIKIYFYGIETRENICVMYNYVLYNDIMDI